MYDTKFYAQPRQDRAAVAGGRAAA